MVHHKYIEEKELVIRKNGLDKIMKLKFNRSKSIHFESKCRYYRNLILKNIDSSSFLLYKDNDFRNRPTYFEWEMLSNFNIIIFTFELDSDGDLRNIGLKIGKINYHIPTFLIQRNNIISKGKPNIFKF